MQILSTHTLATPISIFQRFSSFVYLDNSYGKQDAVRKAQEFWKVESDEKDFILKEAFGS